MKINHLTVGKSSFPQEISTTSVEKSGLCEAQRKAVRIVHIEIQKLKEKSKRMHIFLSFSSFSFYFLLFHFSLFTFYFYSSLPSSASCKAS
mgnify:CR=1 FL=1|jgi:hypothetical protein